MVSFLFGLALLCIIGYLRFNGQKIFFQSNIDCNRYFSDLKYTGIIIQDQFNVPSKFVYCDKGGWTRIMNKINNDHDDFYQNWQSYKDGFGNLLKNHWFGFENLNDLDMLKNYGYLKFEFSNDNETNQNLFIEFSDFIIKSEEKNYELILGKSFQKSPELPDWSSFYNGVEFSTYDRDNGNLSCPMIWRTGWWFHGNISNMNQCLDMCPMCQNSPYYLANDTMLNFKLTKILIKSRFK